MGYCRWRRRQRWRDAEKQRDGEPKGILDHNYWLSVAAYPDFGSAAFPSPVAYRTPIDSYRNPDGTVAHRIRRLMDHVAGWSWISENANSWSLRLEFVMGVFSEWTLWIETFDPSE